MERINKKDLEEALKALTELEQLSVENVKRGLERIQYLRTRIEGLQKQLERIKDERQS